MEFFKLFNLIFHLLIINIMVIFYGGQSPVTRGFLSSKEFVHNFLFFFKSNLKTLY